MSRLPLTDAVPPPTPATAAVAAARMPQRLWWVDLLKAVAAPLIVLHHLAFYGPMSDVAAALAPQLIAWLSRHGRLAVQVFLVVGGFLAARQLAPAGRLRPGAGPLALIKARWLRLLPAYAAMLLLAVLCAGVARQWMHHPATPAAPAFTQLLLHLFMLHDLLGVQALSAGVWYLAVDLQLFALLLGLLWMADRAERQRARRHRASRPLYGPAVVTTAALASALHFNLDARWDVAAPYFFAAYGLGVLAAWVRLAVRPARWLLLAGLLSAAALALAWRERLLLSLAIAALLAVAGHRPAPAGVPGSARTLVEQGARLSYSLFLVHYPVCLLVNAAFTRFLPPSPGVQAFGMVLAFVLSCVAALGFHLTVEAPAARWLSGRRAVVGSALQMP